MKEDKENRAVDTELNAVQDWVIKEGVRAYGTIYRVMSFLLTGIIIITLFVTVSRLPSFGNPDNPANNEVSHKYITEALQDTGAVNMVAGMILDYRAFDTFGESTVLFVAAGTVIILLYNERIKKNKRGSDSVRGPAEDEILSATAGFIIPAAFLFGIYVVLNGHLSPGGGFSGGTIMGASLILFSLAEGQGAVSRFFTYRRFNIIIVSALAFYAAAKSYSFFTGANGLHSVIPNGEPYALISGGLILPLNICVGIIVCCTIYGFFSLFSTGDI